MRSAGCGGRSETFMTDPSPWPAHITFRSGRPWITATVPTDRPILMITATVDLKRCKLAEFHERIRNTLYGHGILH